MTTHLPDYTDDTSPRHRVTVPALAARPSRESTGSPPIAMHESARGTTHTASYARARSLSDPQTPHDARQERVEVERSGAEHHTTFGKGHVYPREGKETKPRHESTPTKKEDRYRHNEDRIDDRKEYPRGLQYTSSRDKFDTRHLSLAHTKGVEPIASTSASSQYVYEKRSRELSALQQECRAVLEEKKALADAHANLKQKYDEQALTLSSVHQTALKQTKDFNNSYEELMRQYDEESKELNTMRQERRAALERKEQLKEDYHMLRQKYEAQKNDNSIMRGRYQTLKATLHQRTSELQGVQRFLTTAIMFSGKDVVDTLEKLNEEVQRTTTFMAERTVEKFTFETPPGDQTSIKLTRTSGVLGVRLMELLRTMKHRDNPIFLDMAFRAYLVYRLHVIASPRNIGQEEHSYNVYIHAIYERMRETEGQAVSGNWRALAFAYSTPATSDSHLASIISSFCEICLAAGSTASKTEIKSVLWSKFAQRIHHSVLLAGRLSKIIGVGATSEDFEVIAIPPNTDFDEKEMEDSYDNGDRVQGTEEHKESVLCPTELGLVQRTKAGSGTGQEGKPSESIIFRPKVALKSVIDIIND